MFSGENRKMSELDTGLLRLSELSDAIKKLKRNKAVEEDEILGEML